MSKLVQGMCVRNYQRSKHGQKCESIQIPNPSSFWWLLSDSWSSRVVDLGVITVIAVPGFVWKYPFLSAKIGDHDPAKASGFDQGSFEKPVSGCFSASTGLSLLAAYEGSDDAPAPSATAAAGSEQCHSPAIFHCVKPMLGRLSLVQHCSLRMSSVFLRMHGLNGVNCLDMLFPTGSSAMQCIQFPSCRWIYYPFTNRKIPLYL